MPSASYPFDVRILLRGERFGGAVASLPLTSPSALIRKTSREYSRRRLRRKNATAMTVEPELKANWFPHEHKYPIVNNSGTRMFLNDFLWSWHRFSFPSVLATCAIDLVLRGYV